MMKRFVSLLLALALWGGAAQAQVVFDAKTAAVTDVGSANTLTVSNMTVGSGTNRALAAVLWFSIGSGQPPGLVVTWDSGGTNQAMTAITGTAVTQSSPQATSVIYGLIAPTSGNHSLVITWTGAALEAHAAAISFTGANQTSVAVAFPNGTSTTGNTATSSVTVTSATGQMAVAAHSQNSSTFATTGNTTLAVGNTGPNLAVAGNYDNGAATVTLTAPLSGGVGLWAASGTNVVAAAGGGATAKPRLMPLTGAGR